MEEKRQRKIDAGREKLEAYKKRKSVEKRGDSDNSSLSHSDTSLSLSPLPLSETTNKPKIVEQEQSNSGCSSISENIEFSNSENDRSLQEIVIANVPDLSQKSTLTENIRKTIPSLNTSDNSVISLNALEIFELDNVFSDGTQNVLDEIIKHDQFDRLDSVKSGALDDLSSLTLRDDCVNKDIELNASQTLFAMNETQKSAGASNVKEPLVAQASTDIESLKEINSSNPSTISLGTSTTEYKQYYDKINLGAIEFQDLLSNRDDHIKQLTEALQQVLEDRNHLQEQTDYFAQEIADLKEQLVQTTAIIKKNNWNISLGNESEKSENVSLIDADKLMSSDPKEKSDKVQSVISNPKEIDFNFDDPELNETLTPEEKRIVTEMRNKINLYIQQKVDEYRKLYELELKVLQDRLQYEKKLRDNTNKLADIRESTNSIPSTFTVNEFQNESDKSDKPKTSKEDTSIDFDIEDPLFNETFSPEEINIIADMRSKIYMFIQQKIQNYKNVHELESKVLHDRLENEKIEHATEIEKLRQLLAGVKSGSMEISELREALNEQHNKEMEELRTYFERRCADIEKHYSEEIFSQQSRKMSDSSVASELESEIYPVAQIGPGGDTLSSVDPPKLDLNSLQLEIQNKYQAELEMLQMDYENRVDEMKINNENIIQEIEQKYLTQIEMLRKDLKEAQNNTVTTQEVASSGDFEIAEVVQSYERRLQEQVMLAKIDIISAFEQQIQTLVSSTSEDAEWPSELLQLRDRLTQHWHKEIKQIREDHVNEIAALKEEHEKILARTVERERRNSLKNGEEIDIRKERDKLKKVSSNLRHLVAELVKYFTKCEDELNNTLVEELLKSGFDKDSTKVESDFNESYSGSEFCDTQKVTRVHFTPDVTGIINLINETTAENVSKDISSEFETELNLCLERLKSEANAILTLTSNLKPKVSDAGDKLEEVKPAPTADKLSSLTRKLLTETQIKNELNVQLQETKDYIENLEAEKLNLENQLEQMTAKQQVLIVELNHAKEKITDLIESGRKEIVSEGYGENQIMGSTTLGGRIASLAELQERARIILAEAGSSAEHPLLQLIEELCREGDRIMEDAKKDHEDLVQQIEAADKKLRATTQFLEEQAVDRELERDEAQREIAALKEQLREGERTRVNCDRINKEDSQSVKLNTCCCQLNATVLKTVEHLEVRMREMTVLMSESEAKKNEIETELKEAIDKIWVLRDIIRDLEGQIEDKTKIEVELKNIITQLEEKVKEESRENEELNQQIDSLKCNPEEQHLKEVIHGLEAEVQKLRVSSELVGPDGVLKQVKTQLNEIEKTLEKRTRDLETLHAVISNTNCSSPSEDMSIRDQIRQLSHGDGDSDLPLEQLARLKDKLIRHARAEDAAMKRIRDLEMQLYTSKQDYEEMQSERDVLQEQLSEQMMIISSLQLRLDEQRLRVEAIQKQTNTSLEHRIYDLENEIKHLQETVHVRDKNIKQLNEIVEQSKNRIADQQKQLNSASDTEKQIVSELYDEMNRLKEENEIMKAKLQDEMNRFCTESAQAKKEMPMRSHSLNTTLTSEFLDSLLADKNADIDRLKAKLNQVEKELGFYSSLSLSKEQLLHMSNEVRNGKRFTDTVLSEISDIEQMRRIDHSVESLHDSGNLVVKSNPNETVFIGSTFRAGTQHSPFTIPEVSLIEKVGPPCVNLTSVGCEAKSDEIVASGDSLKSQKHVRFDDNFDISKLESKIGELLDELHAKNETLKSYESKLSSVSEYVVDIENLRKKLEYSEDVLREQTDSYKNDISVLKDTEKDLRVQLAEAKMELQQNVNKLEQLEKDTVRKDQMYMNLAKEKRDLENNINELNSKLASLEHFETILSEKNKEIYDLENQLAEKSQQGSIESLRETVIEKESDIKNLKEEIIALQRKMQDKVAEIKKLHTDLDYNKYQLAEKGELLEKSEKELKNKTSQCNELFENVNQLKEILNTRNELIKQMEKDLENERKQKLDVLEYENKIKDLESTVADYKTRLESVRLDEAKLSISHLELELAKSRKELAEKDLQLTKDKSVIDELQKDVRHLQDFLTEKDKIIMQMTNDSNSLHTALEAIQSKIQESGNVVDLKKRLREEQNLTSALHEELKALKQNMSQNDQQQSLKLTDSLETLKHSLEKERMVNQELINTKDVLLSEIRNLKEKLSSDEENINKLKHLLEEEKLNSNAIQLQDANIIESMRLRLEAFLDHESESERLLKAEKKARTELEKQLTTLQQRSGPYSLDSNFKMNDINFELTCAKMDLVKMTTENEILKSELNSLKNLQIITNTELKQKEQLNEAQRMEIRELRMRVGNIKDSELEHKELYKRNKREVERKSVEAEGTRLLMADLEEEKIQMHRQIEELRINLRKVQERELELTQQLRLERQRQLDTPVPDKFLSKMRELTTLLQGHIADNKQMSNTVADLTEERRALQNKVKELEERLNIKMPFDDPAARADHLFGRYLKSESYRKALIFQKRYLLTLLASYQKQLPVNLSTLKFVYPQLTRTYKRVNRFRVAAHVIISIHRMEFIVQRWHTGKRIGASVILKKPIPPPTVTASYIPATSPLPDLRPWSGNSPPCKERISRRADMPLGNTIRDGIAVAPLQAPALLTQYIERFDNIQQRLGLALDRATT